MRLRRALSYPRLAALAPAAFVLAGCGHAAESSKAPAPVAIVAGSPAPVACSVRPDPSRRDAAAVTASLHNAGRATVTGVDLTVLDGSATSTFVPLSLAAGKTTTIRRSLPLGAAPSARATCTLTLLQYADGSSVPYAPPVR